MATAVILPLRSEATILLMQYTEAQPTSQAPGRSELTPMTPGTPYHSRSRGGGGGGSRRSGSSSSSSRSGGGGGGGGGGGSSRSSPRRRSGSNIRWPTLRDASF